MVAETRVLSTKLVMLGIEQPNAVEVAAVVTRAQGNSVYKPSFQLDPPDK